MAVAIGAAADAGTAAARTACPAGASGPTALLAAATSQTGCHPAVISGTFSGRNNEGLSWTGTVRLTRYFDTRSGICDGVKIKVTTSRACSPWNGAYEGTAEIKWTRNRTPPADCTYTQPVGSATTKASLQIGAGRDGPVFATKDGWGYSGASATYYPPGDLVCGSQTSKVGDGIESAFYPSAYNGIVHTRDLHTFAGTSVYPGGQTWSWGLKGEDPNTTRSISPKGLAFIKREEGFRARAYNDSVGNCTIGYGTLLSRARCTPAQAQLRFSESKATARLRKDLDKEFEPYVRRVAMPLTQCQYDALVSFRYNTSVDSWASLSRLLTPAGIAKVPDQLGRYIKGKDSTTKRYVVIAEVVGRRTREAVMFQHLPCSCDGVLPRVGLRRGVLAEPFLDDDPYRPSWLFTALDKIPKPRRS